MKYLVKRTMYIPLCQGLSLALLLGLSGCSPGSETSDKGASSQSTESIGSDGASNRKGSGHQVERLDRGLVAVPSDRGILVSWRKLEDDDDSSGVNVYRNGKRISTTAIVNKTNYFDAEGLREAVYEIRADGQTLATTKAWENSYLSIPITAPEDAATPDGVAYSYTANDASVGDLNGDGRYEVVLKWDPTNSKDNSQGGYTGNVYIDAYSLEGERLWRIDMGKNIRAGAHYTQFMVYDFDDDGKAEVALKTADGTVDGQGSVIGDSKADWVTHGGQVEVRDRTGSVVTPDGKYMGQLQGRILEGPEYFSVFEGSTGRVMDTVPYIPQRAPGKDNPTAEQMKTLWGDGYGNRSERYLAGVAYLDGERPSIVMARGYYERSVIAAYDFQEGEITTRWVFDSSAPDVPPHYSGQGNHQLSVADIDNDNKDEIIYGAMAIDHDGSPKWTTALGHGDALHVSDLDPDNPGLEVFGVYEDVGINGGVGSALINAEDGEILWSKPAQKDIGRGLAADVDPNYPGAEMWALNSSSLFNVQGKAIAAVRPKQVNFAIWWDGDLLRELLDGNTIYKWNWRDNAVEVLMAAEGALSNNGTKATPALSADLFGDWREEVIFRAKDNKSLRIYSTNIASDHGITTFMQNRQYRLSVAWQNTAYNQPPHPNFDPKATVVDSRE